MNDEIYIKATVIRNQLKDLKNRLKSLQELLDTVDKKSIGLITEDLCFGNVVCFKESEEPSLYKQILRMGIKEIERMIEKKEKIYAEL